MITDDGEWRICDHPGCLTKIKNHRWGSIKDGASWFVQKDGTGFCPEHIPKWVEEWRKKKERT